MKLRWDDFVKQVHRIKYFIHKPMEYMERDRQNSKIKDR